MGLFSKDIKTMNDLFVHQLKDMYYAEKQITEALPKMMEKTTSPELKLGFQNHLAETNEQVKRLEMIFRMQGISLEEVTCPAIDGIIKEANVVSADVTDKSVLDAALVAAAQTVEHYEIARYGTLIAWAKELGRVDCVKILEQSLEEEKATDRKLTMLAENRINRAAA
ncbi:ferritin-like domain-containing protein [Methylovirgula sp. HY1]|uniref:YciE/YciF ferroxidase family protein n=1 Tax=Methylovirgula sp. HY1 TaxID=2822761 RepID=UPI001C5BA192|nr:ferritin-like domain-containing protein [Methylovirgula sp. HY1]QXX74293.1 hypothetical protein MHY1_01104 [Methylovirgula sp. HY1]